MCLNPSACFAAGTRGLELGWLLIVRYVRDGGMLGGFEL